MSANTFQSHPKRNTNARKYSAMSASTTPAGASVNQYLLSGAAGGFTALDDSLLTHVSRSVSLVSDCSVNWLAAPSVFNQPLASLLLLRDDSCVERRRRERGCQSAMQCRYRGRGERRERHCKTNLWRHIHNGRGAAKPQRRKHVASVVHIQLRHKHRTRQFGLFLARRALRFRRHCRYSTKREGTHRQME